MLYHLRRFFLILLTLVILLVAAVVGVVWFLFAEGNPYPDLTTAPILPDGTLQAVVETDLPVGNVAVSPDGRLFFTVHPESAWTGPKLYEWVDGAPVAFPSEAEQARLFQTPLGLDFDKRNRLWVVDSGNHGFGTPQLFAFDMESGAVVHRHAFTPEVAPKGSFLQDLAVNADGSWVYIADTGFWAKRPALISYEVGVGLAGRFLERHETVLPRNYLIRTGTRDMSYFGGLLSLKVGVDGIALGPDDQWLYYAAMNHDNLYRVPARLLHNRNIDHLNIAVDIETVSRKPLSDGIAVDGQRNVYVTDVEHGALHRVNIDGVSETLIKDSRIRWADGLDFGPDGALYLSDSAVPSLILQDRQVQEAAAPFTIWKFTPPRTPEPDVLPGNAPAGGSD
ncbi:L-dopachrome tautomerase-related protein [Oceanibium sediminis]|uniref:L-dopachrome tautomerase-related protein n=1 Tax=Oceanibium sediminis TaxID=2026339 RepID=UPI000DD30E35|nr:L-dopachrome tautomerase-related protein [Oceanibium sediminis]